MLDELDKKILSCLINDANTPYADIGQQLFVSTSTIYSRMRKMQDLGVVKGVQLHLNYQLLGYDICAFLGIYLDKSSLYDEVAAQLRDIPEIVFAHYTTGLYSIFAKLVCKDTLHLRSVLHDNIQKIQGIQRTETFISLEETIDRHIYLA